MDIVFDLEIMQEFAKQDRLIQRMVKDFGETERAYQIVFNSEVLEDSAIEEEYIRIGESLGKF